MGSKERQVYFDRLTDASGETLNTLVRDGDHIQGPCNPAQDNPAAVRNQHFGSEYLSMRQRRLDDALPSYGSRIEVGKGDINPRDTQALTAKNGVEYAVFRRKGRQLVVRGSKSDVPIDLIEAANLNK